MIREIILGIFLSSQTPGFTLLQAPPLRHVMDLLKGEKGIKSRWESGFVLPEIKFSGSTEICQGQVAILQATPKAHSYQWFKDGNPLTETGPKLIVKNTGNYTVVTTNDKGEKSEISNPLKITVHPKPQKPVITGKFSGCDGESITLFAEEQLNGTVQYEWHRQMESKPFATGNRIQYVIQGDAVVYVTAKTAAGCSSDKIETIEIKSLTPKGQFEFNPKAIPKGGLVTFTSGIENAKSYLWDFGDGEISYEPNPKHYFYQTGSFPVTVTAKSADGCECIINSSTKLLVYDSVLPPQEPALPPTENAFDPSFQEWRIGPNPFHNQLNIFFDSRTSDEAIIQIFNLYGTVVRYQTVKIVPGRNAVTLDSLDRLAKGSYVIRVKTSSFLRTERLIKL